MREASRRRLGSPPAVSGLTKPAAVALPDRHARKETPATLPQVPLPLSWLLPMPGGALRLPGYSGSHVSSSHYPGRSFPSFLRLLSRASPALYSPPPRPPPLLPTAPPLRARVFHRARQFLLSPPVDRASAPASQSAELASEPGSFPSALDRSPRGSPQRASSPQGSRFSQFSKGGRTGSPWVPPEFTTPFSKVFSCCGFRGTLRAGSLRFMSAREVPRRAPDRRIR